MAGIGPVPLAGLMLSEMGAEVLRIERAGSTRPFLTLPDEYDIDRHGRSILRIDLKHWEGAELVLRLAEKADMLIEGFRPDVMEQLGLGPDAVLARNSALIYGRTTGFGQNGPLSDRAGHDITYLAYSGVLHAIGQEGGRPVPPLNLVADYGGGAVMLVAGALAAPFGRFDADDTCARLDGSGLWSDMRGANLLDSRAPFYEPMRRRTHATSPSAALNPCSSPNSQDCCRSTNVLYAANTTGHCGHDRTLWPQMRAAIVDRVGQKTRDDWDRLFAATDSCVAPVLSLREARDHPHNRARNAFVTSGALERPAPAPRFSRSRPTLAAMPADHDCQAATVLARFGLPENRN